MEYKIITGTKKQVEDKVQEAIMAGYVLCGYLIRTGNKIRISAAATLKGLMGESYGYHKENQ